MLKRKQKCNWFRIMSLWIVAVGSTGCVTQAEYVRMERALGVEILSLRQRRDEGFKRTQELERAREKLAEQMKGLQSQYAELNGKYKQTLEDHKQAMERLNQQLNRKDADLKKCGEMVQGSGKKLFELQAELAKKQQELQQKEQDFLKKQQEFAENNKKLLAELKHKEEEVKKKQQELASSLEKVRLLQTQIDGLQKVFKDLQEKLQSLVQAGSLKIRMVEGRLVLQLPEKILFPSGSFRLKPAGESAIAKVTFHLKSMPYRWQVMGHTDSVGNPNYNWRLSSNRALSVLFIMIKNGMSPKQISLSGYGQYQPIAPNDTSENKSLNRRTELVLVPDLSSLFSQTTQTTP